VSADCGCEGRHPVGDKALKERLYKRVGELGKPKGEPVIR
jgi:hypothetical protein